MTAGLCHFFYENIFEKGLDYYYILDYTVFMVSDWREPITGDTKMKTTKFAVFTNEAIYGIGNTISEAMADAYENDISSTELVPLSANSSYSGGVVDLSAAMKLSADGEAVSGADAKLRRCSDDLANLVMERGGAVGFYVTPEGILDIAPK